MQKGNNAMSEKRLNIRVTDEEHARIKAAADRARRSISSYVLLRALDATEHVHASEPPATAGPAAPAVQEVVEKVPLSPREKHEYYAKLYEHKQASKTQP